MQEQLYAHATGAQKFDMPTEKGEHTRGRRSLPLGGSSLVGSTLPYAGRLWDECLNCCFNFLAKVKDELACFGPETQQFEKGSAAKTAKPLEARDLFNGGRIEIEWTFTTTFGGSTKGQESKDKKAFVPVSAVRAVYGLEEGKRDYEAQARCYEQTGTTRDAWEEYIQGPLYDTGAGPPHRGGRPLHGRRLVLAGGGGHQTRLLGGAAADAR